MKFTDGYWRMRDGVTAHYATSVADLAAEDDRITLFAPVRKIRHRGDTLNGALLTVECWSPAEGVIGVRFVHHAGALARGPRFAVESAPDSPAKVTREDSVVVLSSGDLALRVDTAGPWRLEFTADGRPLTSIGERGLGFATDADGRHFMIGQLSLGVGELVYGLGERFTPLTRNGQSVDIWQADGGTNSEQAYKNVPFHLTNRGYGVFVNHPGRVGYEVSSETMGRVQFSVEDQSLEFFVVHGPSPKQVLARYTALTGRPALPPAWSFGLWLSTSFTTSYDEATITGFVQGMADRDIPLSVFHFDCFWMREFQWCDFEWDRRQFPDPKEMLARLRARGLKISLWINPYVAQRSPLFAEGAREGYFIKRTNGRVWQTDQWQPGMAIVDFTNPKAVAWYQGHLRRLLEMGVDCFKTDFGERIPDTGVTYHDGSDPVEMHNLYPLQYNEAVFDLIRQVRGADDAVVFARSAYASAQRCPVHWGGDCWSTFDSMAESLRGGLSLTTCGFGFWSHDIGGFEGNPPPAVYKRWIQFGLLSSHSRLHGSSFYRVPWLVDEESCDVLRAFTHLKHRLMPYLYAKAIEAAETGVPVMRSMLMEHPADPACAPLDRQYHLGEALLVAPVFDETGEVDFYLPEGTWTHLLSGQVRSGGRWFRETHDFMSLPVYVAANTVLPWGAEDGRPDYDFARGTTLRVFGLEDGATAAFSVAAPDGRIAARGTVTRQDRRYVARVTEGALRDWRLSVDGRASAPLAEGAELACSL